MATYTFDRWNQLVIVDDLFTEVDVLELFKAIRDFEDEPANMDISKIADASGLEGLGGGVKVGITVTLYDWYLQFEGRSGPSYILCNVAGGNIVRADTSLEPDDPDYYTNPISPSAFITTNITASSSATLIEQDSAGTAAAVWDVIVGSVVPGSYGEIVRRSAFAGAISLDSSSSFSGITYPLGTVKHPVNNILDAISIGIAEGIYVIRLAEDVAIPGTAVLDYFFVEGAHATKSEITIAPGASTWFTQFTNCYLKGTLDGWVVVRDSMIEDLLGIEGIFHNVMLNPGTLQLAGTQVTHFLSCYSGVPGFNTPELSFNNQNVSCAFRGYIGGIKCTNKNKPEPVSIDLVSGQVIIDDTVTAGDMVLRGVGVWTNEDTYAGGANVVNQLVDPESVASAVYEVQVSDHETAGSFGELMGKKLLTFAQFIGLK